MVTRETRWDTPPGFKRKQPDIQYNPASQMNLNQQANDMQQSSSSASDKDESDETNVKNKWKKAHDPNSGKDYWYNVDTKETTWTMPKELKVKLDVILPLFLRISHFYP